MPLPGDKLELTQKERGYLENLLTEQIEESLDEHIDLEEEVDENRRLYLAEPAQREKSWPWKGASNLVIPMIGTTCDSISARVLNTVFGIDPFWTVRPFHRRFVQFAKPVENFMDWSRKTEFDLYTEAKGCTIETIQDGWSWMKAGWDNHTYRWYEQGKGGKAIPRSTTIRRPNPQHVLLNDVIMQAGIGDPAQAEWKAHRFRLTDSELMARGYDKVYDDVDELIANKEELETFQPTTLIGVRGMSDFVPRTHVNTLYEVWANLSIPFRKDRRPISCVLTYHRGLKRIIRATYNPLMYGGDPFILFRFVQVKGFVAGLGIARMLRYLQHEASTIHNQTVDNATLANTKFFLGKRDRIKGGTRIWPGRILITQDPEHDLREVSLGAIHGAIRDLEISVMAWAEKRSGISDYALGRESSVIGSRATATGTLAILQEGNRRFDLNVRDMRQSFGKLGYSLLELNQQFRPQGIAYFVQGKEEGEWTEKMLNLPREYLANKFGIELTASSATINRQMEQQGLSAFLNILLQNLQVGQQAMLVIDNERIPARTREFTLNAYEGVTKLITRLAGTFDQKDAGDLVPAVEDLNVAAGGQAYGNGAQGPPAPGQGNGALAGPVGIPPGPPANGV